MAIYNVVVTDQAQLTLLNSLLTADGDNTGTFNSIAATAKTANQSLENLSLGPCMKAALKTFEQQNDTIIQVAQTLISAPQTILFGKAKITDPLNPLSMSISTMGLYADSLKGNTRLCVKPS
jgi:ABC-type branched-subunit amino acid transport system ATPase component